MRWFRFTLLAVCLAALVIALPWIEKFFDVNQVANRFVRDRPGHDSQMLCRAQEVNTGALEIEADRIVFPDKACEIVFQREVEIPMAGDGPFPVTHLGFRCHDEAPGPEGTNGLVALLSFRLQLTSYIKAAYDPRGYVPAHASYTRCEGGIE